MDLLANVSTTMPEMASWDFWLGVPARVLMILLIAVVASAAIRLIIRRITRGIEKGTRSRVIRKLDSGRPQWVEDAGLARKRQAQRAQTVGSVLASVVTLVIWAVALLMIVSELGFNIAPVLASAGIAGVALSFGAQSLVKDYLSGIFMVAEDQLGIGDVVDLGEASGVVEDVGLRVTQVRDVQGTLWHVRNGEILRVGNQSQGWARAVLDIPLPYDGDLDAMIERLTDTLANLREDPDVGEFVLADPEVWGVEALTGESVTVRVAAKTAPSQQWAVSRVIRVKIKKMLDAAGLSVPLVNQTMVRGGSGADLYTPASSAEGARPTDPGTAHPGGTEPS
ncbi:mechanosensitive ion channel family protein [Kocuria sp. JC486]|nr:mechanosensitive ion channel family protein [Kocuria sp. JC486]NHU86247.1 mechanosensitive ion channel family protein [Kocuria sp. JC486]